MIDISLPLGAGNRRAATAAPASGATAPRLPSQRPAPAAVLDDPRLESEREVRVAASFYRSLRNAEFVHDQLRQRLGLQPQQIAILGPSDAMTSRFDHWRARWDKLRPAHAEAAPRSHATQLQLAVVVGLGLLAARRPAKPPRKPRFDRMLQRRLASGYHAVVAYDLPDDIAPDTLEALQDSGVYWCVEAPVKRH